MKDRVPVNPGRVLITPENGSAAFYATMTRADNPTQEGTPLNKSSLLKDATAALFGLGTDAVPDDVLVAIKTALTQHDTDIAARAKTATGSYTGTGAYGSANKRTLTFGFRPKLIVISKSPTPDFYVKASADVQGIDFFYWMDGFTKIHVAYEPGAYAWYHAWIYGTVSDTGFTFYNDADTKFNVSGATYQYIAFG